MLQWTFWGEPIRRAESFGWPPDCNGVLAPSYRLSLSVWVGNPPGAWASVAVDHRLHKHTPIELKDTHTSPLCSTLAHCTSWLA
jgi:hypothetical protein